MKKRYFFLPFLFVITSTEATASRNQDIFLIATGLGALSTYLSEQVWVVEGEKYNLFDAEAEYYSGSRETSVFSQGLAIERRLAHWFSVGLEFTIQEMVADSYSAFGMGLNPQFKWFLFGDSLLSPFIAYTSGVSFASQDFPQNGTSFTFRLLYAIGLQFKLNEEHRLRLSFGHLHQSNNNLLSRNPGYDGNGLALSYIWKW